METLHEEGKVFVDKLAQNFGRSESSIRLDLAELESRKLIKRTHGGAILGESIGSDYVLNKNLIILRDETRKEEKKRIGRAVLDFVNDGDSIVIDGGSTTFYVGQCLKAKRGLTIITTSYHMLPILLEINDAKIFLSGGLIHREYEDLIGDISIGSIQRFNPDCAILGIDGISILHGLTIADPSVALRKQKMIEVSKKSIVVADSSKFGKVSLIHIADLDGVNSIISDVGTPVNFVREIEKTNVNLVLV